VSAIQNARVMLAVVYLCLYKILASRVAHCPVGSYDGLGVELRLLLREVELCDLYRSAGIDTVVKYGMLRWAGYVARVR
jgi:hypothetical protein